MNTVLGYQTMNFVGENGKPVSGTMLYFSTTEGLPSGFIGQRAARVWLPADKWEFCLMEGDEFELSYDDQKHITYFGYPRTVDVGFRKR